MPVPVLPLLIGAGGAALLFAGRKEAAAAAAKPTDAVSATPTQQTTGAPSGGASSPSHADMVNTAGDSPQVDGQTTGPATPSDLVEAFESGYTSTGGGSSSGITVGKGEAPSWGSGDGSPSIDTTKINQYPGGALGAIANIAGLTGAAVADTFEEIYGSSVGAVW